MVKSFVGMTLGRRVSIIEDLKIVLDFRIIL